jgi:hypothetical protein
MLILLRKQLRNAHDVKIAQVSPVVRSKKWDQAEFFFGSWFLDRGARVWEI